MVVNVEAAGFTLLDLIFTMRSSGRETRPDGTKGLK